MTHSDIVLLKLESFKIRLIAGSGEVLQLASNGSLKKVEHCAICAVSDLLVDP
jgi:hypothetical protein